MKILLIDDHALFRDGVLMVLEGLGQGVETYEASSYEEAESLLHKYKDIDLILLDLGLPGIGYLDALSAILEHSPASSVVVLSADDDYKIVETSLLAGARGYIPKSSSAKIMLNALQLIIAGGVYVPPEILHRSRLESVQVFSNKCGMKEKLTPRQGEVLQQLAEGKSNKEIALALVLTESTVRAHVASILKALNANNRTQAVQLATKMSWIKVC